MNERVKKLRSARRIKERLNILFEGQVASGSFSLAAGALLYYFYMNSESSLPAIWMNGIGLTSVLRVLFSLWYLNKAGAWEDHDRFKKFETSYSILLFVNAVVMGGAPYAFFGISENQFIILPIIFPLGILVGAVLNLGSSKLGSYTFITGAIASFVSYFIFHKTEVSNMIITAAGLFATFLIASSVKQYKNFIAQQTMLEEKETILAQAQDRMRLEEELVEQKMISTQTAKLASLGEMAGGIAHEVNNPLAIIKMKSDSLKKYHEKKNLL